MNLLNEIANDSGEGFARTATRLLNNSEDREDTLKGFLSELREADIKRCIELTSHLRSFAIPLQIRGCAALRETLLNLLERDFPESVLEDLVGYAELPVNQLPPAIIKKLRWLLYCMISIVLVNDSPQSLALIKNVVSRFPCALFDPLRDRLKDAKYYL
jgi:hypothetical protein